MAFSHRIVVLAENERDCKFYAAALDSAYHKGHVKLSPNDVLFVPSAGKQNLRALAGILVACGVPVVAVGDLDVANDEGVLRSLLSSLNGNFDSISDIWKPATAEFRTEKVKRLNRDVNSTITGILSEEPDAAYSGETKERVTSALYVESPWEALKKFGQLGFRASPKAASQLLDALDAMGLVLVRVGVLEGFAPKLEKRKGLGWVQAAVEAGAHEEGAALAHIQSIVSVGLAIEKQGRARQSSGPTQDAATQGD